MDKNAIKKYAVWARRELISRVSQKAQQFGITEKEIVDANADSVNGRLLSPGEKKQRQALIAKIKREDYEQVMEEVAYTWFNRFSALRFMEVNGYLPSHVRVFTDDEGNFKPQILAEAIQLDLDGLNMDKVYALKEKNDDEALFKYLIITQCNALSAILPGMFQRIADYTELLFPDNLLREGSVLEQMIMLIPEEDWKDQVQIIGWLYQYYNTEPKDKVFADLKKNIKITKENIPAATQLFTPDWIVRYMVENSLGRLWLEHLKAENKPGFSFEKVDFSHFSFDSSSAKKAETLKGNWKYYLDEVEQEPEVQAELAKIRESYKSLKPEDIKCIDPCMGSGHILAYMFDVLMQIYSAYGYNNRDAVKSVIENNLYGLDIDDRAAQLAYFSVMMKARQYDARFFSRKLQPHVYAICESNGLSADMVDYFVGGNAKLKKDMDSLITEMRDAKEYGSILNITPVDFDALYARFDMLSDEISMYDQSIFNDLLPFVCVAQTLAQKYDVVVTNPPYMSVSNAGAKVNDFVRANYPDAKSDMYAVFIQRVVKMIKPNAFQAMITQHGWMFLGSFEKMREPIAHLTVVNMAHLGARAFEEIAGEVVQTTAFVVRNQKDFGYRGLYSRLVDYPSQNSKQDAFLKHQNEHSCCTSRFYNIPGCPFAYWISNVFAKTFTGKLLGDYAQTKQGFATGNNDIFLRFWQEVSTENSQLKSVSVEDAKKSDCKWFPCNKGGSYRKWYGNNIYLANWKNDGFEMRNYSGSVIRNPQFYFKPGITWSSLANQLSLRYSPEGFVFESKGSMCYPNKQSNIEYLLGLLNSKITAEALAVLSPTLDFHEGPMSKVPVVNTDIRANIEISVKNNIAICKDDWDSFETSWDFKRHPLLAYRLMTAYSNETPCGRISDAFTQWEKIAAHRFDELKANEEELNRIFIDIYGLQDELTPEVEDKDVTVRKADLGRDIRSLISFAVGCMFGRYSLDVEGLAYAGGEWDDTYIKTGGLFPSDTLYPSDNLYPSTPQITHIKVDGKRIPLTYAPDTDNIIPICDDEYFEDDITGRFVKFIETVYGKDTLDKNLRFIADALGGSGQPKDVIRNYFLNDFYADHLKIYQKRPIYWLFDSGKKNGFKALIYMHRYAPDTLARMRTDYVHEQQARYRTAIADVEHRMENASASERVKLNKQLAKLQDQAEEIRIFEEKIHHLADQMIRIDLDDGVKHNYAIFEDVLAKIK